MNKYGYFLLTCVLFVFASCNKNDALLTEDSYTQLTIKHKNFPDFSYAGYERSEKPIPLVPVRLTLDPVEGDDGANIQRAIDSVSRLPEVDGFRGAVLLKAGTYEVENTLHIRTSGVVLRGEGQGEDGTVIMATTRAPRMDLFRLIKVTGADSLRETGRAKSPISEKRVTVGSSVVSVADANGFSPGDTVVVVKTVNDDWITVLDAAGYTWKAPDYQMAHVKIITKVDGNDLHLNIPMVDVIDPEFGGGYVATASCGSRISHCGVENMRLIAAYIDENGDAHARSAVHLDQVTHSWVRNITSLHFMLSCVELFGYSAFNTVQDCAALDPKSQIFSGRRYAFFLAGSVTGNLIQRCYTDKALFDFVTTTRVPGPNVFLDCFGADTRWETGGHARWATGILYDNVRSSRLTAMNKGILGYAGWTSAQNMLWNCMATQYFIVDSPPVGINWAIGGRGPYRLGSGYYVSWGIPVLPRSLFMEQLKNRLGPGAVNSVTIPVQRGNKSIWNQLQEWAGSGTPLAGI